jgi:hypothetical protein
MILQDRTRCWWSRLPLVAYLRLLDADAEGADWQEVARIVLHIDPIREPARARKAFESHLAREMDDRARLPAALARWRIGLTEQIPDQRQRRDQQHAHDGAVAEAVHELERGRPTKGR